MILTIDEMVKILRSSVNVQYEEADVTDSAYLTMTDEDILLFVKLGCSRAFPSITDLSDLDEGSEYPIVLLAKIELYTKLAVLKADKIDLVADNNNQLKQSQRFDHYMKLVAQAKEEYDSWVEDSVSGAIGGVQCYDVILANRHHTRRNYELTPTPKVKLKIGTVSNDSIDFSWSVSNTSHFGRYKVYISTTPIVDMFRDGAKAENKITEGATLVKSTSNIRDNFHRVTGLLPETVYYVAVISVERNLVFGYAECSVTTLEAFVEEDEVNQDTIDSEVNVDG